MKSNEITLEKKNSIATLKFNRPEAFNAVNTNAIRLFHDHVNNLSCDPSIRCVILTGTGNKAFCAGGDISEFSQNLDKLDYLVREMTGFLHIGVSRLARLHAPVIASINGVAAGAGLSLMAICDMAIACKSATFTSAYTKVGLSPDGSSTYFLQRLINRRRLMELYLTNRVLNANEALEWGLINKVVDDNLLEEETSKLASNLANGPTQAYSSVKKLLNETWTETLETQMERETIEIAKMTQTQDAQNGIKSFVNKEKPNFTGK